MSRFTPLSGYPQVLAEGDNRVPQIITAQSFNATTSDIKFGLATSQDLTTQTILALVYPTGAGENNEARIFGKTLNLSPSGQGLMIMHGSGSPYIIAYFGSTGSSQNPYVSSAVILDIYGSWSHIASTFDGSINYSGIKLYYVKNSGPLIDVVDSGVNGSGSANTFSTESLHIGNREGTDRTFNGHIAYVARWNRVLSLTELRFAQAWGPQAVPQGLVFYWVNGQDLGPYHLQPTSQTAVGVGPTVPVAFSTSDSEVVA